MGTAFLYGNGGGVSSGSCITLTVTAPVGCTVTVSKDDKTYTKSAGSSGSATFKGLSSGAWSVTISNSSQTVTDTIDINVDYAITLAFFSATINVTYPSGSTCTATDGTITLDAPDTSGTWVCVVPNAGTWTITSTSADSSKTSSRDVSITESGQSESATISYIYWAFDEGNSVDYTGGWLSSYNGKPWKTYEPSTVIAVESGTGPNSYAYNVGITSDTAIDLTGFSILYITVSKYNTSGGAVGISETDDTHASYVVSTSISSQKTYTIDVSSYTGNYYLRMNSGGGQHPGGPSWVTFGYQISKLWLE